MTPQILIVSEESKSWLEEEYKHTHDDSDGEHVCILHERVIDEKEAKEKTKRAEWEKTAIWWRWLRQYYHPWHHHHKMRILAQTARGSNFERKPVSQPAQEPLKKVKTAPTFPGRPGPGILQRRSSYLRTAPIANPSPDYEMRVTWDVFLHKVCAMYSGYGSHPTAFDEPQEALKHYSVYEGMRRVHSYIDGYHLYQRRNFARTDAAVTFRYWSWDMMPSDLTRPLATITIGHLVILAVRLGMQWRVLNLERGMSADGHGYSLSSTTSDKLGLVFKLIAFAPEQAINLIPNKAVDKLICGILPGCSILVKRDFDMIDANRKNLLNLGLALDQNHLLEQIGVPRHARQLLSDGVNVQRRTYPSIHNELVPLLCSFLPLQGSNSVRHYAHCWLERRKSVLHLWEGRYVLLHYLQQAVSPEKVAAAQDDIGEPLDYMKNRVKARDFLQKLQNEYPEDFFGLKNNKAIDGIAHPKPSQSDGLQRRKMLIRLCRIIHRWTDSSLFRLGFAEEDEQGRSQYENLVAAHLNMATYSTTDIYQREDDKDMPSCPLDDPKVPGQLADILKGVRNMEEHVKPPWVLCRLIREAQGYVEQMQRGEHTIANYLRERGSRCTPDQLETAWWMLMLRGIAWNMSTIDHVWGQPIPASFYDNHVPAWIT